MISIITPTYNRAAVLPRMLDSIVQQEDRDWELILVDDGSTDNTRAVLEPYLRDARIRFIEKLNTGAADSRNVGVRHAKSDYIIFVDSDDLVLPGWLGAFHRLVAQEPDLAFCGLEIVNEGSGRVARTAVPAVSFSFFPAPVNFLAGSFAMRRALFEEIDGFNKELPSGHHSDIELKCLRVNDSRKLTTVSTDEILVRVFRHDLGKIREQPEKVIRGTQMLLAAYPELFRRDKNKYTSYLRVLAREYKKQGDRANQRKYLFKAAAAKPLDLKNYIRILRSFL